MSKPDRPDRKIADVCIGDIYAVTIAGRVFSMEILRREDSGVWLALNQGTGGKMILAFADLGRLVARVDADITGTADDNLPRGFVDAAAQYVDRKRAAAGDRE